MATSLGTNVVVVTRVRCNQNGLSDTKGNKNINLKMYASMSWEFLALRLYTGSMQKITSNVVSFIFTFSARQNGKISKTKHLHSSRLMN